MLIDFRNDRGSDLRGGMPRRMLRSGYPRAGMACPIVNLKPLSSQAQRGLCGADAQELTPYLNAYGTVPSSSTV